MEHGGKKQQAKKTKPKNLEFKTLLKSRKKSSDFKKTKPSTSLGFCFYSALKNKNPPQIILERAIPAGRIKEVLQE